jgi:hypothetical protein
VQIGWGRLGYAGRVRPGSDGQGRRCIMPVGRRAVGEASGGMTVGEVTGVQTFWIRGTCCIGDVSKQGHG